MMIDAYPGDEVFQKKITELGIERNVYEIKMYLSGVLLGPEIIPPSHILEEILYDKYGDEVEFENEDSYVAFMNMFMGLWNKIVGFSGSSSRYPKLSPQRKTFTSFEDKVNYVLKKSEEGSAFFEGIDLSDGESYIGQNFDLLMCQIGISMMNDLFLDFIDSYDIGEKITDQDISEMLIVIDDFEKCWPDSYREMNRLMTGIRSGSIQLDDEDEMQRKVDEFKSGISSEYR